MNILAFNTAFKSANIVYEFETNVFEKTFDPDSKQSENLLVGIDELFTKSNSSLVDVESLAVVEGPGSFTGLRIGIVTAKAFLTAYKKLKCVKINSLELLAYEYFLKNSSSDKCIAIINALSGKFFVAKYDNKLNCILTPQLVEANVLADIVKDEKNFAINEEDSEFFKMPSISFSAKNLLDLAKQKIERQEFVDQNNLVPLYLRLSQAEDEYLKKNKN